MGQIPNNTYTTPDGSVYRVEADGSVTKIKGGRVQSNEPPSKYNITSDGKIYRVESDGSVTYLGNAEDRATSQTSYSDIPQGTKKSSHIWIWIIIILIAIGIAVAFARFSSNNYISTVESKSPKPALSTANFDETSAWKVDESPVKSESSIESPADNNEQYAFICDGNFYGKIGNSEISGFMNWETEEPNGTLYYIRTGSEKGLDIYGAADGSDWYEYYNGELTGTIRFDYWNLENENFARGTYIRNSDGKLFSVTLYKTIY